ncbi:zinc finger and SCAN domain-containing protein 21-like isoform X3 [Anolis sagrei]|uniref:zinc finger and SCAN domain-containing protein 21-like isoform X3 n=1 Tax=Anolis sagrei TaxID=38937 RepID=UPI003520275D
MEATLVTLHPRTGVWLEGRKGMDEPYPTSLQLEQGTPREGGKAGIRVQSEYATEGSTWKTLEEGKDFPGQRMQQHWEAQWQEFLKTFQSPSLAWGSLPPTEEMPWDEAKAFLASFEQVAKACRWPKEEWAARLLPALSGEAEQAFQSLEARDREDYEKVKAAILRAEALRVELQRQHFRQFCCQVVEDPRRVYSQVQELCSRWLKPERRSKEQILELLVLEQFLASLPQDLQGWVRGAGPETCSQAVALAEDFLLKRQQETNSTQWQGPSQDVYVGSLESEGKSADVAQGQIYEEAQPVKYAAIPLLGGEIKGPSPSVSVFPPEGQVKTEAGLDEGLLDCKDTAVSLHRVERTLSQPGQQTIFWQVLQEEGGNAQLFGEGKPTSLKVEASQHGGGELEERPEAVPLVNQGDGLLTEETCGQRSNEKRCWIQTGTSEPGESLPNKRHKVRAETLRQSVPMTPKIQDPRYGSERRQKRKPPDEKHKEPSGLTRSLKCAADETSQVPVEGGKALLPKSGRKSCYKSDLGVTGLVGSPIGCPMSGEDILTKSFLSQPQEMLKGENQQVISTRGESPHQRNISVQLQNIHPGKKPYDCLADQRSLKHRQTLKKHRKGDSRRELYICSLCGKSFTSRTELTRHQIIHTGEKPYKCLECGRSFNRRENLMRHQRIHTGEKPYECLWCGKCFRWKHQLTRHQKRHAGE